ncbi:hypothetical protein BPNPMPFG_002064 [Mesorhizobium sp. AR07]|uniref:hypothetical protein n=1 Tax=Mesorhizobium sp. AR07 TaxID=2865838 RepID=UPI0021604A47|nr:hypothetical protein [Mesorhizobium sp. AR07]UVK46420.1 hypothetical protein BPNPMPFG_002064 [Mesorhizobium sp. AR07]
MYNCPIELRDDLNHTLVKTIYEFGIVNVPVLAAQLIGRRSDLSLVDAERLVLGFAEFYSAPIEFDRSGCDWRLRKPVGRNNDGLLLDIVENEFGRAA